MRGNVETMSNKICVNNKEPDITTKSDLNIDIQEKYESLSLDTKIE